MPPQPRVYFHRFGTLLNFTAATEDLFQISMEELGYLIDRATTILVDALMKVAD
jgi:hypothetical protein